MDWVRAIVRAVFWTGVVIVFVLVMGYVGYIQDAP